MADMTASEAALPAAPRPRPRTAVVGSGVSGLTAAHVLSQQHHVTLFEADDRLGGHAHTHTVSARASAGAAETRVDSGFIVHNDRTYPHLTRLFDELGVVVRDTEMSMSISDPVSGVEFAGGRGVSGFLARPRQLLSRDYLTMLRSVRRFHEEATGFLASTGDEVTTTYGDFIAARGFPASFVELYAVPLVSCVWSSGRGDALDYPARYLFQFLDHHGMLSVTGSPQWRTVVGGSATYVEAVAAGLESRGSEVRRGIAVTGIARDDDGVDVHVADGGGGGSGVVERFDHVVVATHGDDALRLLADATPAEKEVLGAFRYSRNETVLHRDPSLLPRARWARASWNYRVARPSSTATDGATGPVVTYDMTRLMGLPADDPLYVTLNATALIDPSTVVAVMDYSHPIHDLAAVRAQHRRDEITTARTAFAGAHWGWGFHEDGCRSGVEAAAALGVEWA
ncbi:putative NAD/FAD-binding protein [Knoellia remsis]|uniref:Putative NAD/FAD-binding protein n=2 Tax=Knoellia remsis TaxID=407159 RepID=A0A2T0UJE5_9MICO|nr:FAD-dependent oxidoreductase [Knoellia remsis]PRY58069.1 putative NAD/FAD-binding protein [Knoellia remsis]